MVRQGFQLQLQLVALGNQLPVRGGGGGHQADGRARQAGAAGAADAVGVVVGRARQVVVDDHGQGINVDAARRQVGGHQHLPLVGLELLQHALARALAQLAMQGGGKDLLGIQLVGHMLGAVAAGHEHQHALAGVLGDQRAQHIGALGGVHIQGALGDGGVLLVGVFHFHAGVAGAQQLRHQVLHGGAEGGRQQQGLALLLGGQQGQHLFQFLGKAQVHQAVGLVHHQGLQAVQLELAVRHHVQQAPGGGDHPVHAAAQRHQLWVDGDATGQYRHLGALPQGFAQVVDQLGHLGGQLARGHQHQGLRGARPGALAGIAQHPGLQQRQHIGRCLARARGRADAQVLAIQHGGDGLGLHRRGRDQALGGGGMGQRRGKAKGGEGHGRRAKKQQRR